MSSPLLSDLFRSLGSDRWDLLQDPRALLAWGLRRWPSTEARLAVRLALAIEDLSAETSCLAVASPSHSSGGSADASAPVEAAAAPETPEAAELLIAQALQGRSHLRPGCAICGGRATSRIGKRWRCDSCGAWRAWSHPSWTDARARWLDYLEERRIDYGRLKGLLRSQGRLGPHQMDDLERAYLQREIDNGDLQLDTIRRSEGS